MFFSIFESIVTHLYSEGIVNRSCALLKFSAADKLDWEGVLIHWNHDDDDDDEASSDAFSKSAEVGLDGADSNSSTFGSSSNFVNVTNTLTVDTTGIAIWICKEMKWLFSHIYKPKE